MKDLRISRPAKAIAFVLCVVCLTAALCCTAPLSWTDRMGAADGYGGYKDNVEELLLEQYTEPIASVLADFSQGKEEDTDQQVRARMRDVSSWMDRDGNLFYTVRGADGRLIVSSEELGDYRARYTQTVTLPEVVTVQESYGTAARREDALNHLQDRYDSVTVLGTTDPEEGAFRLKARCYDGEGVLAETVTMSFETEEEARSRIEELREMYDRVDCDLENASQDGYGLEAQCISYDRGETVTVGSFIRAEMTSSGQTWQQLSRAAALYNARPVYYTVLAAGAVIGLLCLAFLLWSAGHERDRDGIVLGRFDRKAPADLILPAGILALLIWLAAGIDVPGGETVPGPFPVLPFGLLCIALAIGLYLLLSVVRRVKAKEDQRGSLFCTRAGRVCARGLKKAGGWLEKAAGKLPLFWLAAVVFLAFAFLEGLSVIAIHEGLLPGVVFWFLLKVLECAGIVWIVLAFRSLQEGGKELAAGNLDYQVPLTALKGPFRDHGEDLNAIRDAIQANLEERMKAQRMKTELITNVSHDIKTPLTSIVSYVDLLKKQEMPTPEANEYLEVLDRQSARLKKLTEDLVEASKASTGNIPVELEHTDVNVLLAQSAGEYQERLKAKGLIPVVSPAEGSPAILADGRLLWRVLDNLLSNIQKYAQPGTRVYLSCQADGDRVTLLFRNISSSPLNISADELMERFVRGDESRSTEGSGLGLSIAQDLTRLQGGTFELAIDGDLFKVRLAFPRVK